MNKNESTKCYQSVSVFFGEFWCWDPGAPASTGIPNFVSKHRSNAARQFPESCSRMTSTRCELLIVPLCSTCFSAQRSVLVGIVRIC